MATEPLWKLNAVSLAPERLREVSLELCPGVTALIGWSGAGKTSLLNLLVGFETPTSGLIDARSRSLAWVPQNGGLWPQCSVAEHLRLAGAAPAAVAELLAAFDLEELAQARPEVLSEGEQSRLSVARALASRAEVMLMDEPLVHVDPARAGKYWRAIRSHLAATGGSLIFSTHVPETVLAEAQSVICLRKGRVLHQAAVLELYTRPSTAELMNFLGPGNWLAAEVAARWLGLELSAPRCFRPEQLWIVEAAQGKAIVESARFCGSVEEVWLRDLAGEQTQVFYHRPTGPWLAAGMRVEVSA